MEQISKIRAFNKRDKQDRQVKTKIQRTAQYQKINSRYTDHIMTDVDIQKEADQLHQTVRAQISVPEFDYINAASENKENYLKQLKEKQERESRVLQEDDILILPFDPESEQAKSTEAAICEQYGISHSSKRVNTFFSGVPENPRFAKKILEFRNQIRVHKANLSDVAQHVRIIPIVMQLLKSPFYRTELGQQYTLWRQLRKEKILSSKFQLDANSEGNKRDENDVYEHSQKIKIGGILKHLLDLWTVEDIFQACILCSFWICGKMQVHLDDERSSISISQHFGDLEITDLSQETDDEAIQNGKVDFVENNLKSFSEESKIGKNFNQGEVSQILKLTFDWVLDIEKSKQKLEDAKGSPSKKDPKNEYSNIDYQKVKTLRLESFIKDLDNIETLCSNLRNRDVFKLFEFTETTEDYKIDIDQLSLSGLIIAENNIYESLTEKNDKYKNTLRTKEELKEEHIGIWFLSNLLLSDSRHEETLNNYIEINSKMKPQDPIPKTDATSQNPTSEDISENNPDTENILEELKKEETKENTSKIKNMINPLDTYSNVDRPCNYIPLTKVMNHFYSSPTDQIWLRQQIGTSPISDKIFNAFAHKSMVTEICTELLMTFSLMKENKLLSSSSVKAFKKKEIDQSQDETIDLILSIPQLFQIVELDIKKTSALKPIKLQDLKLQKLDKFSGEFEEHLSSLLSKYLSGGLELAQEMKLTNLLFDECYLDLCRHYDSSFIIKQINSSCEKSVIELETLSSKQSGTSTKNLMEELKDFIPEAGSEIRFFSRREDTFYEEFCASSDYTRHYLDMLKNVKESTSQILCKKNARKYWDSIDSKIEEVFKKLEREKINDKPEPTRKFTYHEKGNRYDLGGETDEGKNFKKEVNHFRRFVPEMKKGKEESIVESEVWKKVWPFVKDSYWKVQQGIVTWFAIMVNGSRWEDEVLRLLKKIKLDKAYSRRAAIQVMGVLSEFFKLYANELKGLTEVPWWVFAASDTIFGYTETLTEEHSGWQKDVLLSIMSWMDKRKNENFSGVNMGYDIEMSMEHFLTKFKTSLGASYLMSYDEDHSYTNKPSTRTHYATDEEKLYLQSLKQEADNVLQKRMLQHLLFDEEKEDYIMIANYFNWCKRFTKFSVEGSAYGIKIGIENVEGVSIHIETNQEGEENDQDQFMEEGESSKNNIQNESFHPEKASKLKKDKFDAKKKHAAKGTEDDGEENVLEMVEAEEILENIEIQPEKEFELANNLRQEETTAVSKTVAFARSGKNLARILFWCGGDKYTPIYNLSLKREPKKIRNIVNSDVVSFVKQSYLYEWLSESLRNSVKSSIYSLVHPRDKVYCVERLLRTFQGEKWSVPMDMKDFHVQFGPTNHKSFIDCLTRKLLTVRDSNTRSELEYILKTLRDELCRGKLVYIDKTSERESLNAAYTKIKKEITNTTIRGTFEKKKRLTITGSGKEKYHEYTMNNIGIDVNNGILSGWKLTSIMGSIYNNTTNMLTNFWHLNKFGVIPTNYATMGDDTHFKCRFGAQALFHVGFVNAIGKEAHPQKQFFSTYKSEFLKKIYNINEKMISSSPCSMISSLLFEKENRKSKANNKDCIKDMIDMWNLMLVRIPDEDRVYEICHKKFYAQKAVRMKFKLHIEEEVLIEDEDTGRRQQRRQPICSVEDMCKVFSTPSNVNGYLMGPLTKHQHLHDLRTQFRNIKFMFKLQYFDILMKDYTLVRNAEENKSDWKGINSMVSDIVSKLPESVKTGRPEMMSKLKGNLIKDMQDALIESLNQYKEPSGSLGALTTSVTDEFANIFMGIIDEKILAVEKFLRENFLLYLGRNELATPYTQLMILTSDLSKEVERGIRFCGNKICNRDLYETLSNIRPYNKFTYKVFNDLNTRMCHRNLFDFALTSTIGVSVTRYIQLDEYLGMISTVINESIPLLFMKSTDIFNFEDVIKRLNFENEDLMSEETASEMAGKKDSEISILKKSRPLKERRRELYKYMDSLLTQTNLEKRFINFLVMVLEIYLFKNHESMLKDARNYILHQIDLTPFSVVMPEDNFN